MELLSKSADKNSPFSLLGKIIAPHGLRGALKVHSLSDFPEYFSEIEEVYFLDDPDAQTGRGPFKLAQVQHQKASLYLFMLSDFNSRSQAEAVNKQFLAIPIEQEPELAPGDFYIRDVIGCQAQNEAGEVIGKITHFVQSLQDLLVLETPEGTEHWIPSVKELVPELDLEQKIVTIRPVPGLLD